MVTRTARWFLTSSSAAIATTYYGTVVLLAGGLFQIGVDQSGQTWGSKLDNEHGTSSTSSTASIDFNFKPMTVY